MKNTKQGKNQYRTKYRYPLGLTGRAWKYIFILLAFMATVAYFGWRIQHPWKPISPCPEGGCQVTVTYVKPIGDEPTPENIVAWIAKIFAPEGKKVIKQALDISACESGWKSDAYNWNTNNTADWSIFQINDIWKSTYGDSYKKSWKINVVVAHEIYRRSHSFDRWVCANKI